MKEEIWKDVKGFEGRYEVSNFGRVRSVSRMVGMEYNNPHYSKGKLLTIRTNRNASGYSCVSMAQYGRKNRPKQFYVHRIVAEAFIENPLGYNEINHKDENKQNNCADNLEWCDRMYNIRYGTAIERKIKSMEKSVCRKVIMISSVGETIYPSITKAAKNNNLQHYQVYSCCKNGSIINGLKFRFYNGDRG